MLNCKAIDTSSYEEPSKLYQWFFYQPDWEDEDRSFPIRVLKKISWYSVGWPRQEIGRIYRRVKYIISWIPYLWSDYDFDHVYIWKIMSKKISNIADYTERNGYHYGDKNNIKWMRRCVKLIDQYCSDFDFSEYYCHLEKHNARKEGKTEEWIKQNIPDDEIYINGDQLFEEGVEIQMRKTPYSLDVRHDMSEKMKAKRLKLILKILETQSEKWWS